MELQIDIDVIAVFNKSIKNKYLHNFCAIFQNSYRK